MRFVVLPLALAALFAGCTMPEPSAPPEPIMDPASLSVPTWAVGDAWDYLGADGTWQNWTVEAIEERHGFDTYRVRIDWSRPDGFGIRTYTTWIDQATLGAVAEQQADLYAWGECPAYRPFPLEDKRYGCVFHVNKQGDFPVEFDVRVTDGDVVEVPAGAFATVEVEGYDAETGERFEHGWFSPDAGQFVRRYDDRGGGPVLYELVRED